MFKYLRYFEIGISFIFFLFVVSSCSDSQLESNAININIDVMKCDSGYAFSQIIESDYEFLVLESSKKCTIGHIDKVQFVDNYVYVFDRHITKRIFKFSRAGKFISIIGESETPNFYFKNPTDFIVDRKNGNILVLDSGEYIYIFDSEGKFIRADRISNLAYTPFYITQLQDGYAFVTAGSDDNIIIANNKYEVIDSYFPFISLYLSRLSIAPLQTVGDNVIIYRQFLNDQIFKVNNGVLEPYIWLNFNHNYPPSLFNEYMPRNRFASVLSKSDAKLLKLYFENTQSIHLSFLYKGYTYLGYFDKEKQNLFLVKKGDMINDVTFDIKTSYVIGTTDNKFIFYIEPKNLVDGIVSVKKRPIMNIEYRKAFKLSKTLTENQNPILLIASVELGTK